VNLPSRTATAAIVATGILVTLGAGGDPLGTTEILEIDAYGSELL